MNSKIDLHQDLVSTYLGNEQAFLDNVFIEGNHTGYNAGTAHQYEKAGITMIGAAIRPYEVEWDLSNPVTRKTTFKQELIAQQQASYQKLVHPRIQFFLHLEGADHVRSLQDLQVLKDLGIRSIGLVRNYDNALVGTHTSSTGLTDFGRQAIQWMNENNMLIDLAHISRKGMEDIISMSTKPVINTHSNIHTLQPHTRNIPDNILKQLADKGGVVGLNLYGPFIWSSEQTTIDDLLKHLDYGLNSFGSELFALGTDYHGIPQSKAPNGLQTVDGLLALEEAITKKRGSALANKFFYENARRVIG